jgi:hypothetical protein
MSGKYENLPGYDITSPTIYGDTEEATRANLPESDQDWKNREEDENVEIISCDAAEAIRKFKNGEIQTPELKGEQLTEAVEASRNLVNRMTQPNPNLREESLSKTVAAASSKGSSLRIYSNSAESLRVLEQRVAKLEQLVSVPSDPLQSGGSLSEVAASVSSKMAFLEPEQLAQADARLASLLERFNQVPDSLQKLPDLSKWESLFSSIPQIVERLETLGPLHALAGRVGASLVALEKSHEQIISRLDRTEATQNELHSAMSQNIKVATENAKKLGERVEKLQ